MANMLPKREEGKKETQWRLEDMYASNEAWEADAALLSEKIEKLGASRDGWERAQRFSWRCSGCTTRQICFLKRCMCMPISGIMRIPATAFIRRCPAGRRR